MLIWLIFVIGQQSQSSVMRKLADLHYIDYTSLIEVFDMCGTNDKSFLLLPGNNIYL